MANGDGISRRSEGFGAGSTAGSLAAGGLGRGLNVHSQRKGLRELGRPDWLSVRLHRLFFRDAARSVRSRVLLKNVFLADARDTPGLSPAFLESLGDAWLRAQLLEDQVQRQRHHTLWRTHLEARGELLGQVDRVALPNPRDFMELGWLPDAARPREARAEQRTWLLKACALGGVMARRDSLNLSLFAEACRGQDDTLAPLVESLLRDNARRVLAMDQALEVLAGEALEDYVLYLRHAAWAAHSAWADRMLRTRLVAFLEDPAFGRGTARGFWRMMALRTPGAHAENTPWPLAPDQFDREALGFRARKAAWTLPELLLGRREGDPGRRDPIEVHVETQIDAAPDLVFQALGHLESWHRWAIHLWNVTPRDPDGLMRVGATLLLRLKGGDQLTQTVLEFNPEERISVVEAQNPPFPLHTYVNAVRVQADGMGSRVCFELRCWLRSNAAAAPFRLGIARVMRHHFTSDLKRFKKLCEDPAYALALKHSPPDAQAPSPLESGNA